MNTFLAGIFGLQGPELLLMALFLGIIALIIFVIVKVVGGGAAKEQRIAKLVADELERRKENENKH
jgi:hypothetical protein